MLHTLKLSVLALVLTVSFAGISRATEPCYAVKKVVCYETRVCYENRTESYKKYVTRYDHCNRPYTAVEWCDRVVSVPVKKVVAVVKYVRVYY